MRASLVAFDLPVNEQDWDDPADDAHAIKELAEGNSHRQAGRLNEGKVLGRVGTALTRLRGLGHSSAGSARAGARRPRRLAPAYGAGRGTPARARRRSG